MRGKVFVVALALAPVIYLLFIRPLLISEEARIRKGVKEGIQAIEAEDVGKCLRHVSLHYKDEYGLTYVGVKGLLIRIFQEFDGFEVDLRDLQIAFLDKEVASATFGLKVKVSHRGEWVYLLGSGDFSNRVKLTLTKEGDRWKVTQVEGVEGHGIGQGLPRVVRRCRHNTV